MSWRFAKRVLRAAVHVPARWRVGAHACVSIDTSARLLIKPLFASSVDDETGNLAVPGHAGNKREKKVPPRRAPPAHSRAWLAALHAWPPWLRASRATYLEGVGRTYGPREGTCCWWCCCWWWWCDGTPGLATEVRAGACSESNDNDRAKFARRPPSGRIRKRTPRVLERRVVGVRSFDSWSSAPFCDIAGGVVFTNRHAGTTAQQNALFLAAHLVPLLWESHERARSPQARRPPA